MLPKGYFVFIDVLQLIVLIGGPWRTRTSNLLIKSQLLYQLS
jgi:hypothetical protein